MLDYWTPSQENKVLIGVRENGEKLLVKSEDEYTSPIEKIYKVEGEYIIADRKLALHVCQCVYSNQAHFVNQVKYIIP